ncbi:hypothetical protein FQN57_000758 [Myotisia sp. PD_48]|nr:hypothetical protein FQN57_000758 [Myotisia sp. PD_48]
MRFGLYFYQFQVPEWSSFYVNYNQLKKLVKAAAKEASQSGVTPNFGELDECLRSGAEVIKAFHIETHTFLHLKEYQFCKRYGIDVHSSSIPGIADVNKGEIKDILDSYSELQRYLNKVLWYVRVNEEAVRRVSAKFEEIIEEFDPSYNLVEIRYMETLVACETQYLDYLQRIDNVIANLTDAYCIQRFDYIPQSIYFAFKRRVQSSSDPGIWASIQTASDALAKEGIVAQLLKQLPPKQAAANDVEAFGMTGLLTATILHDLKQVAEAVLEQPWTLPLNLDNDWLNHMIVVVGRDQPSTPSDSPCPRTKLLLQVVNSLTSSQVNDLSVPDTLGRLPLHYAAIHNSKEVCQAILALLQNPIAEQALVTADKSSHTPLHYAVIHGHVRIVTLFLNTLLRTEGPTLHIRLRQILSSLIGIAIRAQNLDIFEALVSCSICDLSQTIDREETPLFIAAQVGSESILERLVVSPHQYTTSVIDKAEAEIGWTPLIVASASGYKGIVERLLKSGANPATIDYHGWTAKDHAAFQGHLDVARMLDDIKDTLSLTEEATQDIILKPLSPMLRARPSPLCDDEVLLVLNLGSMQRSKEVTAVDLTGCFSEYTGITPMDNRYSLEISIANSRLSHTLRLPLLADRTEPLLFQTTKADNYFLKLNIVFTKSNKKRGELVGSGIASLGNDHLVYGSTREPLVRLKTTSILAKGSLKLMGTVSFTYLLASAFHHDLPPKSSQSTNFVLKHKHEVELVGHRDVQLTRDHIPVVYHDFSFSESGTDIPLHDLSFDQFLHSGSSNSPETSKPAVDKTHVQRYRPRAQSLTKDGKQDVVEIEERLRYTVEFITKGYKSNTRGSVIQESFATLEDLLVKLPDSISFLVEIKYPRLHEAQRTGTAPIGVELNMFIDSILEKIFRFGKNRSIILASFTPEASILLTVKQDRYPVMFITNAGKTPVEDFEERVRSVQVAVRFAKHWNLAGIVLAAEPLLLSPKLIRYIQHSGLACASYGILNNIPEKAQAQVKAGIDLLIVDKVGPIGRMLNNLYRRDGTEEKQ